MRSAIVLLMLSFTVSCASTPEPQALAPVRPSLEPRRPTVAEQQRCAEQAKKAFSDFSSPNDKEVVAEDYTNHFDPQKTVCYVRVATTMMIAGKPSNAITVFDAYERRVFATYTWVNPNGKKYWEVKPVECEVMPSDQPKITCDSAEQFNALVQKWFGVSE